MVATSHRYFLWFILLLFPSSPGPAQTQSEGGAGLPHNFNAGAFQTTAELMWQSSPTFRRQCARIAAEPSLTVTVRAEGSRGSAGVRAHTELSRSHGAVSHADMVLFDPRDAIELIAHEMEHIIEQIDGVQLHEAVCAGHRMPGTVRESCRAIEVGRRVAREVDDSHLRRLSTVRQHDQFSGPYDTGTANVSANGRYIVFRSSARLSPEDGDDQADLYILTVDSGAIHLETEHPGWADGFTGFLEPSISADGRIIAVRALVTRQGSPVVGSWRVVMVDRIAGTFRVLGNDPLDSEFVANGSVAVSADGSTVAFDSVARSRDGKSTPAVYVTRLGSGSFEAVSTSTGSLTPAHGVTPSISADGRFVAFTSLDDLTCGFSTQACAGTTRDRNRKADIYVRDTLEKRTVRVSRTSDGGDPNGASSWPSISADGRYVAFTSEASNLVKNDRNGTADVFLYDIQAGSTELVSRRPEGKAANGPSLYPAISGDASAVGFQSLASDLVCQRRCQESASDINLLWDVFLFDRQSHAIVRVSADGQGEWFAPSRRPSIDYLGRVVAFSSREPIDAADVTNDDDLFVSVRTGMAANMWR